MVLFEKQLFDLEVKGQCPRKVIMIHVTPPYGHAPIPNIIDLSQKKQLFDLEVKGQGPNKRHYGTRHTSYGHGSMSEQFQNLIGKIVESSRT